MTDVAALNVSATETGVAKVDKALLGLAGSAMKAETATGRFTRSAAGIDAMFKSSTGARDRAKDIEHYAQEMDNLRAKYNPLFAASKRYEAALEGIAVAERKGAITANEAAAARTRLASSLAPDRIDAAGNSMKNYGMHTANVFSQLNDIGVMMASGQNPLTLALQQGTQLNQVWGQMGGKVGAIGSVLKGAFMSLLNPINLVTIGVIAGGAALVNYFMGGSEGAKTLNDRLDDLDTSLSRMNENVKIYSADGVQGLIDKYGEVNVQILQMIERQNQFAQNAAMQDARNVISDITAEYGGMLSMLEAGGRAGQAAFFAMNRDLGLSGQEALRLRDAIEDVKSATTFEEQASALSKMNYLLGRSKAGASDLAEKASEAEDKVRQLANSAPKASWMNAAIDGVNSLIGRIGAAINANAKLAKANSFTGVSGGLAQQYAQYGAGRTSAEGMIGAGAGGSTDTRSKWMDDSGFGGGGGEGKKGGGGGGAKDPYQNNLDRLVTSLMTERETVEKWYADNEILLNDKRAKEILGASAHKEAMLDLERQYQEKISKIKDDSDRYNLQSTSQFFGDLNSLAGGGYDGLMRAQKSFAAASALVNTYLAASQALADPKLSTFAKFIAVAKVVAAGMGLVNAIKGGSKSSGGGGSGGGSSSAPTTAGTAAVEPTRTTTVNFQGDPFMVAIAESVMSQMYDATGNGRVLIKA